jgi:hypothetical protein
MLSIGDWRYTKDFTSTIFDENQQAIGEGTLYLKDAKVGDAAQFTSYFSADYRLGKKVNVDFGYRFVDGLYADYSIVDAVFTQPDNEGALKLPSYGLADLGVTARFGNLPSEVTSTTCLMLFTSLNQKPISMRLLVLKLGMVLMFVTQYGSVSEELGTLV